MVTCICRSFCHTTCIEPSPMPFVLVAWLFLTVPQKPWPQTWKPFTTRAGTASLYTMMRRFSRASQCLHFVESPAFVQWVCLESEPWAIPGIGLCASASVQLSHACRSQAGLRLFNNFVRARDLGRLKKAFLACMSFLRLGWLRMGSALA